MSSHCSVLVLDFGGVISRTLFETHPQTERALGLPAGTLAWRGPFAPDAGTRWRDILARLIAERDYWNHRTREVGRLVGETWESVPDFLARACGDHPATIIRSEALDAIARVGAAGRRLAIIFNEFDLFYGAGFRSKLTFLAQIDLIFDATNTKVLKPGRRACIRHRGVGIARVFLGLPRRPIEECGGCREGRHGDRAFRRDPSQPRATAGRWPCLNCDGKARACVTPIF